MVTEVICISISTASGFHFLSLAILTYHFLLVSQFPHTMCVLVKWFLVPPCRANHQPADTLHSRHPASPTGSGTRYSQMPGQLHGYGGSLVWVATSFLASRGDRVCFALGPEDTTLEQGLSSALQRSPHAPVSRCAPKGGVTRSGRSPHLGKRMSVAANDPIKSVTTPPGTDPCNAGALPALRQVLTRDLGLLWWLFALQD